MRNVELANIEVPDFGLPDALPTVPKEEYEARIEIVRARMHEWGLDFVVVYGDREHFANVTFLTGYDPRFEETLLVIGAGQKPILLVGNEGINYSRVSPLDLDRRLYQSFSLMAQDRARSDPLSNILRECGITSRARVGVVGWKYFEPKESPEPNYWFDVPSFIVDILRDITGGREYVTNSTAMFIHPEEGLRVTSSVDQLAQFEFVATYCSQAVRDLIANVREGMTEFEAVQLMRLNGIPLSCHVMLSAGPRAHLGLVSPSDRVMQKGDPFFTALGLQGGLTARAGFLVHEAGELPVEAADYLEVVVKPYYAAAVEWWERVGLGASAGEVFDVIHRHLIDTGVGLALNPGHLLHLDEWVHSPFFKGSPHRLRSGMTLQCDIIPRPPAKYFSTNVEDGLALADEELQDEFANKYPSAWNRIVMRRQFMKEALGIRLKPEVLLFSNLPAVLTPYILNPELAMRVTE